MIYLTVLDALPVFTAKRDHQRAHNAILTNIHKKDQIHALPAVINCRDMVQIVDVLQATITKTTECSLQKQFKIAYLARLANTLIALDIQVVLRVIHLVRHLVLEALKNQIANAWDS